MARTVNPYMQMTEEERAAVSEAMFGLVLWIEDHRGYFTWMWVGGTALIIHTIYQGTNGAYHGDSWWPMINSILGCVLLISGVALRIYAAVLRRHFLRMESFALGHRVPW